MFVIVPKNAHRISIKIYITIAPTCFGVLTPFSWNLQVVSAKIMNY